MTAVSASSAVAEALSQFRAGVGKSSPPEEPSESPKKPAAGPKKKRVPYSLPNGGTYYAREVGEYTDVDILLRNRGKTVKGNLNTLLWGEPGTGKGSPLNTPVLTPGGWKAIGDLVVGDEVIGSDGKPTGVFGVYDRGVLPTYRVTMSDGSWVDVDGTHLWRIQWRRGTWRTVSTRELIDGWDKYSKFKPAIPQIGAYDPPAVDLPIPPYMLGALIADGALSGASVTWTKNDQAIADEFVRQIEGSGYSLHERKPFAVRRWGVRHTGDGPNSSVLNGALDSLGLRVKSGEKFIPSIYKTASLSQRRALLAGLMDGDGRTVTGKGQAVYHTTSRRLAEDVRELMWSLGESASMGLCRKKDGTWRVGLLSRTSPFLASKYADSFIAARQVNRRCIESIHRVEDQEIRCIAVTADDHLYTTRDYIVTHNSVLPLAAFGDELIVFEGDGDTVVDEFLGSWVQNPDGTYSWVDGPLVVAAEQGRPLFIDEIAQISPKVMAVVYAAMDGRGQFTVKGNHRRGTIVVKDGFFVIGACNPNAPGARMSEALMSRFTVHIKATTDYDLAKEMGVPTKIVTAAKNLAIRRLEGTCEWAPEMRELLAFRDAMERMDLKFAIGNLIGVAPEDSRPIVADALSRAFGSAVRPLEMGPAARV